MTQPFRLGFLTHLRGERDPRQLYQETLELFVAADQLGFDVGWVAQHHFRGPEGGLPSPFPFLAAAAQRTKRLRLGTSIVVLPLENPVRVAEDAAVVDTLSDGRLELGVGSGSDAGEFQAFGMDVADRLELTTSGLSTLKRALRDEPLGEAGKQLQPPAPSLIDRIWQSGASPIGAQFVAKAGSGLMLSRSAWADDDRRTDQVQLPIVEAYEGAWQCKSARPRIALSRGAYVAADKQSALAEMGPDVSKAIERLVSNGRISADRSLADLCDSHYFYAYGNPEEVAASLAADVVLPHAADLILQFDPVYPSLDKALWMLEQIATQVGPALGWQPRSAFQTGKSVV